MLSQKRRSADILRSVMFAAKGRDFAKIFQTGYFFVGNYRKNGNMKP
jgi:hypothetical protein